MSKNNHISDFLDYYLALFTSPEYAILITGEWGVGKTWFMKQYLSDRKVKHLYVSLNGVSTFSEIEDQFFEQLHPVLASKPMKIASKVFKGILKTAMNIDWNGDGKVDASVSSNVPDINLPEYFRSADDKLLVFDDLERCVMPIPSILGYINQFTESNGLKAIILANENEIIKADQQHDEKCRPYLLIKEKLIGKTFNILSDPNDAIISFAEQISDANVKDILLDNAVTVLSIYTISDYHNLRHLRQSILDFERFFNYLPNNIACHQKLTEHIISIFFAISIELKKGYITYRDLPQMLNPYLSSKSDNPQSVASIKGKYWILTNDISPISDKDWISFFRMGCVDSNSVSQSIAQSRYFEKDNRPDWQKLWLYYELSDNEFEEIRDRMFKEFKGMERQDSLITIQLTGIFLRLVKYRMLDSTDEEIIKIGKASLEFCRGNGGLKLPKSHEPYPYTTSHGYSYMSQENPNFIDFLEFAGKLMQDYVRENSGTEALSLLDELRRSVTAFNGKISMSKDSTGEYWDRPVLHQINASDFVDTYLALSSNDKIEVGRAMEKRYQFDDYSIKLFDEIPWLTTILEQIRSRKISGTRAVSHFLLEENLFGILGKSLRKLQNLKDSQEKTLND